VALSDGLKRSDSEAGSSCVSTAKLKDVLNLTYISQSVLMVRCLRIRMKFLPPTSRPTHTTIHCVGLFLGVIRPGREANLSLGLRDG
jgi:hypothetical protein